MNFLLKRIISSLALIIIIYLSLQSLTILFIFLILLTYFSIYESIQIFKNIFKNSYFLKFLLICFSVFYISFFSFSIWIYLNSNNILQTISIILILIICASTDIGGFVFGKLIGGKKLTKISPNKTYSGAIGSFVLALIFGYLFLNFYNVTLSSEINIFILIILISLISQIGDLFISLLKRKANIKDTGSILPGHGGILDRIDGLLLALPIGMMLISY